MTFEDSPTLDGKPHRRNGIDWIIEHRRAVLLVTTTLTGAVLGLLWLVYIATRPPDLPYGGLDGCLVTESGQPASASIRIADQTTDTYSDGCFFFAALPPETHTLRVYMADTLVREQQVIIRSGEAVGLETVVLEDLQP